MKKIALLILLTGFSLTFAQIPKPQKNTYVNDFAKVLTKAQVTALNQDISKIENEAGVQLAIVLVNKIPAAYDIEDYTLLIGRKWHVGNRKRGLVYVAAIKQHKQRLEVATDLQTVFPHDKSAAILDAIKPDFKAGDYNAGLQTLVAKLSDELILPPANTAQPLAVTPVPPVKTDESLSGTEIFLGVVFFILLPLFLIVKAIRRKQRNRNAQAFYNSQNPGVNYPAGHPSYNPGYHNHGGSGIGNVLGGIAAGAALGYAARSLQDNYDAQQDNANYDPNYNADDNNSDTDNSSSDSSSSWGNWGSDSSSSSDSSSDYSSSSDDSGFSGSDSSSDSGSSSDW